MENEDFENIFKEYSDLYKTWEIGEDLTIKLMLISELRSINWSLKEIDKSINNM